MIEACAGQSQQPLVTGVIEHLKRGQFLISFPLNEFKHTPVWLPAVVLDGAGLAIGVVPSQNCSHCIITDISSQDLFSTWQLHARLLWPLQWCRGPNTVAGRGAGAEI